MLATWSDFFLTIFIVLFIIVSVFLMLLILIQKGRGGGLVGAFGGVGGNTAFGSKTGDVLTWATAIVFGVFILLAVILNYVSNAQQSSAGLPVSTVVQSQQTTGTARHWDRRPAAKPTTPPASSAAH